MEERLQKYTTVWWWKHLEVNMMSTLYSMLAETKRLPPDIHRCFRLGFRTRWRWLNGKCRTFFFLFFFFKAWNNIRTDKCLQASLVHTQLFQEWRIEPNCTGWLDEMVGKLMQLQAGYKCHQPHPKQRKTKILFSTQFIKKETPCSKSVQWKYILGSTSKGTLRLYTLPSIYYLYK